MLALILALIIALLKAIGVAAAIYIFYWRVIDYYRALRFYRAQGEDVVKFSYGHLPVIGNAYMLAWSAWKSWKEGDNYFIMKHSFDWEIKYSNYASIVQFLTNEAGIGIGDVKIVEALYTSKNKYFDKHPLIGDLTFCLTGDSILFAPTSDDWRKSRKAISPAFYKGKLEKLVEVGKSAVATTLQRFKKISSESGPEAEIDIMEEIGMMQARILLVCSLGVDCAEELVDFWIGGRCTKKTLAYSLRETFSNLVNRIISPHIVIFPFLARWHITPFERD